MATKKAVPKKTATKATSTKKAVVKRKSSAKKPAVQSFRRTSESQPFMTFKLTKQTFYWLVIAVISVIFAIWVYKLQSDINKLYDQVDYIRSTEVQIPVKKTKPTE